MSATQAAAWPSPYHGWQHPLPPAGVPLPPLQLPATPGAADWCWAHFLHPRHPTRHHHHLLLLLPALLHPLGWHPWLCEHSWRGLWCACCAPLLRRRLLQHHLLRLSWLLLLLRSALLAPCPVGPAALPWHSPGGPAAAAAQWLGSPAVPAAAPRSLHQMRQRLLLPALPPPAPPPAAVTPWAGHEHTVCFAVAHKQLLTHNTGCHNMR